MSEQMKQIKVVKRTFKQGDEQKQIYVLQQ